MDSDNYFRLLLTWYSTMTYEALFIPTIIGAGNRGIGVTYPPENK